jgi:hypothetical protein
MLGARLVVPRYQCVALIRSEKPQLLSPLMMLYAARRSALAVPTALKPFGLEAA